MTYSFFVDGTPKPQPRPRMTRKGHVYNPSTATAWKEKIGWMVRAQGLKRPLRGPIDLELRFFIATSTKSLIYSPCEKRPDLDNYVKAAMDALTDAHAWEDDSQVWQLTTSKKYGSAAGLWVEMKTDD